MVTYRKLVEILTQAGIEDAGFEVEALFRHVTGSGHLGRDAPTEQEWQQLLALAGQRARRIPLQYLLGSWPFLDMELAVGPGVLIPRPETEEVCLACVDLLEKSPRVLDLCAGSGAIALGIQQRRPEAKVTAVEWDSGAFVYLEKNIQSYRQKDSPKAVQADVFSYYKELEEKSFDLIVSNPPYVTEEEYAHLAPELYHEPKQALLAKKQGLEFYFEITQHYTSKLKPGGWLVFEIGASQGRAVSGLLAEAGYQPRVQKDLSGQDRMVIGHYSQ